MAVGAIEPVFYERLLAGLGLAPEVLRADQLDASSWPRVAGVFEDVFATRSRQEWVEVFAGLDACVAPVLSPAEAAADAHLVARGTYAAPAGSGAPVQPGVAPRFSASPAQIGAPAVRPGRHTQEVLRELGLARGD
jgi:alpha-methylacyl-CoA racemase